MDFELFRRKISHRIHRTHGSLTGMVSNPQNSLRFARLFCEFEYPKPSGFCEFCEFCGRLYHHEMQIMVDAEAGDLRYG